MSSTSPNLQNIVSASEDFKEGNWWREAFKVSKGRRLVVADFGSQELRTVADLAKDKVMIDAFKEGKDLHALAASAIYGIPVEKITKEQRREAKIFNFSVLYGAGEDKVSDQFKVSRAKAKQLIANYYTTFSGLKKYQETTFAKTLENGYILVDKLGRKSWLPKYEEYKWTKSKRLLAEYSRINSNFPIQGSAASMMKYAAILLRAALIGTSGKIVLLVHDEALVECDKEESEKIKSIVERCMSTAAKYFCPIVPPPAEAIVSNCWNK